MAKVEKLNKSQTIKKALAEHPDKQPAEIAQILNDAKDKPVLQRVFTPADYLTNKNDLIKGFGSNNEQTIKLYFELSGPKASGYHVGVFYP